MNDPLFTVRVGDKYARLSITRKRMNDGKLHKTLELCDSPAALRPAEATACIKRARAMGLSTQLANA